MEKCHSHIAGTMQNNDLKWTSLALQEELEYESIELTSSTLESINTGVLSNRENTQEEKAKLIKRNNFNCVLKGLKK